MAETIEPAWLQALRAERERVKSEPLPDNTNKRRAAHNAKVDGIDHAIRFLASYTETGIGRG